MLQYDSVLASSYACESCERHNDDVGDVSEADERSTRESVEHIEPCICKREMEKDM